MVSANVCICFSEIIGRILSSYIICVNSVATVCIDFIFLFFKQQEFCNHLNGNFNVIDLCVYVCVRARVLFFVISVMTATL